MGSTNRVSVLVRGMIAFSLIGFLGACSPAPRKLLTQEQRVADLYWLFSQFEGNYAPLQYKQQKYHFNFETLKTQYLKDVQATKTNEEFYLLMHRFVAEFKDAHTASSLSAASLPGRTNVAYLGFDGIRKGDTLVVTKLLPTISSDSAYPIKEKDVIAALDGVPLKEIVLKEFVRYRNLGQDESNLTYHMPKIFNRTSLNQALPTRDTATLTLLRDKKEVTVNLPWIVKDLYTFTAEQKKAAEDKKKAEEDKKEKSAKFASSDTIENLDMATFFKIGLQGLTGERTISPSIAKQILRSAPGFNYQDSFVFMDNAPTWSSKALTKILSENMGATETPLDELKRERNVPDNAIIINPAATFPVYITSEKIIGKDDKPTGTSKLIAYMYLNTFSPDDSDEAKKEVAATLKTLKMFGVKDIIIDMIDNGGGSLNLGMELAQLLSTTKIIAPEIQFKVSESWVDAFQKASMKGPSDSEKEIARRVFEVLKKDQDKGDLLSEKWDFETLAPFSLNANTDLEENFNITLLVNEMCASMCDIFTATLKDNKMATIVGSKTMGAGGNVVMHPESPNSHLIVNQTESLMVRRDGSYIENNGVEPDTAMDVSASATDKYTAVRAKAIEQIVKVR